MLLDTEAFSVTTRKRRTRTNIRQSKYGCFTCRSRRVKCDEAKPSCLRCQKSGRECEGYPAGTPSAPASSYDHAIVSVNSGDLTVVTAPLRGSPSLGPDRELDRLQSLACMVFSRGAPGVRTALESGFWSYVVPQLMYSIPCVKEAAKAFGASYEQQMLKPRCPISGLTALKQIASSVSKIRQDIATLPHGPLPIIVACVLLASAETLHNRHTDALLHLRGAFTVISMREQLACKSSACQAPLDDEVSYLFGKLDLQVITYALGMAPELQLSNIQRATDYDDGMLTPQIADRTLFQALHSCYGFTSRASEYKYLPCAAARAQLVVEQGRHIAELTAWLRKSRRCGRNVGDPPSDIDRLRGLVLQAHCLSALIYVSNILEPHETAYDKYASQFEQIVQCVEEVMSASPRDTSMPTFNIEMGVIQPLFLTAAKYRDSKWRAKAISLLQRCGREGPWCGYVEAAAALCTVRAEVDAACQTTNVALHAAPGQLPSLRPQDIPERARVAGYTLYDIVEGSWGDKLAVVELSRCRDMDTMLACHEKSADRNEHWLIWHETCELEMSQ